MKWVHQGFILTYFLERDIRSISFGKDVRRGKAILISYTIYNSVEAWTNHILGQQLTDPFKIRYSLHISLFVLGVND
jgi:hypothetical protein